METASVKIKIYGRVKGIGYRAFARTQAKTLGITGYALNLPDENAVEIEAEGEKYRLEEFISSLKSGPPLSRITKIETDWSKFSGRYSDFSIR